MMQLITINEGQCFLDVAVQHCGDAALAFDIAFANGKSLTADLVVGETFFVPMPAIEKLKIVEVFAKNNLIPASIKDSETISLQEGIGFWAIGQEFKLS